VLFDGPGIGLMMEMTIVQIVDVAVMLDGGVTAVSAVLVIVVFVNVRHNSFLSNCENQIPVL
jgi:hypothetical protein